VIGARVEELDESVETASLAKNGQRLDGLTASRRAWASGRTGMQRESPMQEVQGQLLGWSKSFAIENAFENRFGPPESLDNLGY
jgi:hypothetical protein